MNIKELIEELNKFPPMTQSAILIRGFGGVSTITPVSSVTLRNLEYDGSTVVILSQGLVELDDCSSPVTIEGVDYEGK